MKGILTDRGPDRRKIGTKTHQMLRTQTFSNPPPSASAKTLAVILKR